MKAVGTSSGLHGFFIFIKKKAVMIHGLFYDTQTERGMDHVYSGL
jgi:hypothetical protein